MPKNLTSLILAAISALLIVAIALGFLSGFTNPVPWLLIVVLLLIPKIYDYVKAKELIQWQQGYSVGHPLMDEDHKKLLQLVNKFKTAYDYHTSEDYEREALEELIEYTKFHFQREEALMADHNYPELDAHKAEHKKMIEQVEGFVELYHQQGHKSLNKIADFLQNWLLNHINGIDKQYSSHLK
jgi:hemerythrin